jgi:uncharacterized protein YecE (DUF72 family)
VARWREVAPRGFLFAAKFPRELTHEKVLVDCRRETEAFVRTMHDLDDKLGPLLLQLPPGFSVEGKEVLDRFLRELPKGPRYAVEVRHRSWMASGLPDLLRERGAALALVDYPGMPRLDEATAPFPTSAGWGTAASFPPATPDRKRTGTKICAGGRRRGRVPRGG